MFLCTGSTSTCRVICDGVWLHHEITGGVVSPLVSPPAGGAGTVNVEESEPLTSCPYTAQSQIHCVCSTCQKSSGIGMLQEVVIGAVLVWLEPAIVKRGCSSNLLCNAGKEHHSISKTIVPPFFILAV